MQLLYFLIFICQWIRSKSDHFFLIPFLVVILFPLNPTKNPSKSQNPSKDKLLGFFLLPPTVPGLNSTQETRTRGMNDGGCDYERLGHFDFSLSTLSLILFFDFFFCSFSFPLYVLCLIKHFGSSPLILGKVMNSKRFWIKKSPFCVLLRPKRRFLVSVTNDFWPLRDVAG